MALTHDESSPYRSLTADGPRSTEECGLTQVTGSSRLLRAMNERAVLAHLIEAGRLTRPELRGLTGLSKPTISDAVRRLTQAGLAVVVGVVG